MPDLEVLMNKTPKTAAVSAFLTTVLASTAASAEPTSCPASQRAVFACSTGAKTVAVCGSADLSATAGTLQYRFGRPRAVELAYPAAGADWRSVTRGKTLMFSGGGGAFLAFHKGPYRYVVFTAVGRGWGEKAGVLVEQNGRRIASLRCKRPVVSELGPDLFSQAGIAEAEADIELP
jgi:hypothetical protein